jgi:mono/diheme cytochrome c family protein
MSGKTIITRGRLVAVLVSLAAGAAQAAGAKGPDGKAVFDLHCAACHARGPGDEGRAMPAGTEALHFKYRNGEKPPTLEDRDDLPYPVLNVFVRHGTGSMPGFRKTELSDDEIKAIAGYLAASAKAAQKKRAN